MQKNKYRGIRRELSLKKRKKAFNVLWNGWSGFRNCYDWNYVNTYKAYLCSNPERYYFQNSHRRDIYKYSGYWYNNMKKCSCWWCTKQHIYKPSYQFKKSSLRVDE